MVCFKNTWRTKGKFKTEAMKNTFFGLTFFILSSSHLFLEIGSDVKMPLVVKDNNKTTQIHPHCNWQLVFFGLRRVIVSIAKGRLQGNLPHFYRFEDLIDWFYTPSSNEVFYFYSVFRRILPRQIQFYAGYV